MFNKNYYTPLLKNKRFLALLIESIILLTITGVDIAILVVKHG